MIDNAIEAAARDARAEFEVEFSYVESRLGRLVRRLLGEAAEAGYWLGYLAGRREGLFYSKAAQACARARGYVAGRAAGRLLERHGLEDSERASFEADDALASFLATVERVESAG